MTHVATETALPELLESVAALRDGEVGPRSLAVLESTVGHGEMSPLHAHDEDEAFRVLEGVLVMHIGAETTRLEPGESIVAPSGVPHALGADSDARYLTTTFARSIRLYEDFVRAVGRPDPDAPSEDAAVVAAIGQANGIVVLGPPGCSRAETRCHGAEGFRLPPGGNNQPCSNGDTRSSAGWPGSSGSAI